MNKIISLIIVLNFFKIVSAQSQIGNSIIFLYDTDMKLARPIVIYKDGKYLEPPLELSLFENPNMAEDEINTQVNRFKNELSKLNSLFLLNNGIKYEEISVTQITDYFGANLKCPALEIESIPKHKLLSNNPKLGTNILQNLDKNDRPKLKKRKMDALFGGGFYPNNLISKVDIDGDGIPELIYEIVDYERYWIEVYSKKNGSWVRVYRGVEDGS